MGTVEGLPNFRRGVLPIVILSLLKREDMYGYQLVQETQRCSGGDLTTQEGSLYPVLYKLLDQGCISDRRVKVGKRMARIYYHLEPAGVAYLEELIREYETVTRGVMRIVEGKRGEGFEQRICTDALLCEGMEITSMQTQTEAADPLQGSCQGTGMAGTEPKPALC